MQLSLGGMVAIIVAFVGGALLIYRMGLTASGSWTTLGGNFAVFSVMLSLLTVCFYLLYRWLR